jgi:hypothetical protein
MAESNYVGLKMRRSNNTTQKPTYHCDNCKCARYSRCTCQRKGDKTDK